MSIRDLAALAREHTEEAVQIAREIMLDPFAEDRDRLRAVEFFAERGYGKAAQAVIAVPLTKRVAQQLFGMDDSELLEIIDTARPAKRLPVTLDAEVVPAIDPLLE